jgi:hypothetical protein
MKPVRNPIASPTTLALLTLSSVAGAESVIDKAAVADDVAYFCAAIGDEQKVASQALDLGMTVQQWQAWRCAAEAAKAGVDGDELVRRAVTSRGTPRPHKAQSGCTQAGIGTKRRAAEPDDRSGRAGSARGRAQATRDPARVRRQDHA